MPISEIERLTDELRRSYAGDAWPGPALSELINDLPAAAWRKPLPGAHSIGEIVLHIASWERVTAAALAGMPMPGSDFEDNWPRVVATDEQAWAETQQTLSVSHRVLLEAVRALAPERLDEIAPGRTYTVRNLLDGITQHNHYHAGQIALLRKG